MAKSRKSKEPVISDKRVQRENIQKNSKTRNKSDKGRKKAHPNDKPETSINGFPIVGIGASAGGLEAFTQLLEALPIDTGMAFILVQHLDPTHESLASEILSRTTRMFVHEVEDGVRVLPNHVYMIPPNSKMALLHGVLSLLPRIKTHGQALVIDSFFQSLALDQKGRAIGVVLSGTASDGTQGLKAIKAEGGLAVAQDPKSAKYDGMPKSAIASGAVDLILSPKEIAQELARISKHPYIAAACEAKTQASSDDHEEAKKDMQPDDALRKIFVLLRTQMQVDFSNYKHTTLKRRIQRRMMVRKSENIDAYAKYLQDNPNEVKALYYDILINVTEFFRDPDSFNALRDHVFTQLIKNRNAEAPIRVWVPGCSTGEEAYSLVILLLEFLSEVQAKIPIQIFATDISELAIQKARAGVYSESIERAVSKERLKLFFDKVGGGYKIKKEIRDLCLFSRHDVTSDPPFSKLDLVSCRNILIYFAAVLQKRIIPVFHYALNPGGFLWLGTSENPEAGHSKLFAFVDKTHKIYSKTNLPTPMTFRLPLSTYVPEVEAIAQKAPQRVKGGDDFQKAADRIALSKYAPPSVIVNADLEILQFRGRTVPYLETASGLPSNHLLKMARPELLHALHKTIQLAAKQNTPARQEELSFEIDGRRRTVNIEVIPANPMALSSQRNFVIFFEEASSTPIPVKPKHGTKKEQNKSSRDKQGQRISQLEQDLLASKQYQQSMGEEFEATQEELTSANEELQSTNEELQSTNEELETAKEELQSSNEELNTVNDELQNRNTDLTALSSDLNNLLSSVEIPILIVGNDHRIRRFTPKAEKFFKLISSDIGRPIGDIRSSLDLDLDALVSEVVESLRPQEKEIKDRQGRWMRLQIRPYKTVDNRIDGAVIALVDIESLKQQIKEGKKAQDYLTSVAETVTLPLVLLDDQLRLRSANRVFWEHFKLSPKLTGKNFFAILEMQGDDLRSTAKQIRKLLTDTMRVNKKVRDCEVDLEFPNIGRRTLLLSASLIQWMGKMLQEPQAILLSLEDITVRKRVEENLAQESKNVRLFEAVTVAANEGKDSDSVLQIFLDRICAHTGWSIGHVYLATNGDSGEFISSKVWYLDDPKKFTRFKEGTELLNLASGAGLPGKVFTTRNSVSTCDLIQDLVSQKARFAEEVGIRSALGFPVFVGRSIVAVLEFFSTEDKEPDHNVIKIINHVIPQLGWVFERKRSKEALAQLLGKEQEARAAAEAANLTKDAFLATLSHELRTPLTSILSWAQLIQRQEFDPDKLKHGIETIEQSAKTQGQLIDDLLDISRIQSGKFSINFMEVDPRVPVKQAVEAVRLVAEKKHVVIETEINIQSEIVWGDPERLQQIVWNLLTNAIKFSSKDGTIRVRVEPIEEQGTRCLSIKVIDQGKGIQPEFLCKLFERFSQADSSSVRVHGGLGLGLAIVRELAHLQGGTVWAESEGLGKGSTFTILLPFKSGATEVTGEPRTPAEKKTQEEAGSPDLAGLCVMIVEDEPKTLEVLTEALNSFGAKTIPCGSAVEALAAFDKFKPDILVSDIAMPGEDGYSLMRKIRMLGPEQSGDISSLALTAYATEADVKRALSAGFDTHMAKPYDTLSLGQAIAKLVKNKVKDERS